MLSYRFHLHHHLSAHTAVSAGLALASALAFAIAIVAQQRAAEQVSDEHARSGRLFHQLIRSRMWVAGTVSNTLGFILQAVALGYGSLLVVQPLLVSSLLFALPLSAWLAHRRISKPTTRWALLLVVALAVFVTVGNPNHGADRGSKTGWLIAAAVLGPLVALSLIAAGRAHGARRASLLAVATGLLGGMLAVFTKAVVGEISHLGVLSIVEHWELYGLIVVGVGGIYLQQLSFQAGALQASWPIITVLEPIVAAALGLGLLHEKMRVDHLRLALLILAAVAMVVATAALSRRAALDAPPPSADASSPSADAPSPATEPHEA